MDSNQQLRCRIITNEQLDVLYEVEKFLLDVTDNVEPIESLSRTIRELDPSSGFNQGTENEKGEEIINENENKD